ncbi:hypothetical protein K1719_016301 [Acacia pycnantha]|nr:hypothetical protein K1719_016301 [Acacia pycnantha]
MNLLFSAPPNTIVAVSCRTFAVATLPAAEMSACSVAVANVQQPPFYFRDKKAFDIREHGEDLVGTRVQVWWPVDCKYLRGTIHSFDPAKKKHKVAYDDGFGHILNLAKEEWDIIADENDSDVAFNIKEYGEDLVGSNVQVWWPIDCKYLRGVINSFDPTKKKHKVAYDAGFEEILNLAQEKWDLLY